MKIQISQQEIEQFVREGISRTIQLTNAGDMKIDFTAGRGENGLTATIDVPYMGVTGVDFSAPAKAVSQPVVGTPIGAVSNAGPSTVVNPAAEPVTPDTTPFPTTAEANAPVAEEAAAAPTSTSATTGGSLFQSPVTQ